MKKYLTLFFAGVFLLLSSCATNSDIDNLQSQIDGLKSGQIATITNQISSITGSITSLQEADREIKGYISVLQNTATELQKSINSAAGKIDDLEKAFALVNSAIENLQSKDSALERRIDDLKDYVDTQLRSAKDWVSATFATLEQYNGIVSEIGGLRGSISSINTAMEQMESRLNGKITLVKGEIEEAYTKAMGTLESSLKNWVNEQLEGYWTIAETEGKLDALRGSLEKEDESIREDIGKLRASLDSAKTELTEGYKAAIKKAIEEHNGVLDGKLSEAVSGLNTRIDGEVSTINERIGRLEKRVLDLESSVTKLLSRIQSLSYIPRYTDGASTMWVKTLSGIIAEALDTLEFRISPSYCADSLVKVWNKAVSAEAVSLLTRGSQETVTLSVVSVSGGNGKISVVVDGSTLVKEFYTGKQPMAMVVSISDGVNERTSEYITIVPKQITLSNNVIYYTSSNEEIVIPAETFGANIISNEYKNGRGILVFDGDVTSIGKRAFYNCAELTSIIIPNSITRFEEKAFMRSGLSSIVIPDSVTHIGEQAFSLCEGLSHIEIPEFVTRIEDNAFVGCTGLTSIEIPNSVTYLAYHAFAGCNGLTKITILATSAPLLGSDVFAGTNDCPIYVPKESVEAYKSAQGWSVYADRIRANDYGKYDSNVTWTSGSSAYTQEATVNGKTGVQVLKLGTSSKAGDATVVIPKGTKSVSFYGVSWKGNPATLMVKKGDTEIYSQDLAANDGASSNSPYTITVTDNDHYTMTLPSQLTEDTNVTITTADGGKTRIILFGIRAE